MKFTVKIVVLICLLFLINAKFTAQTTNAAVVPACAYLTINGEKLDNPNGWIDYNTSFFIKHIVMDEKTKQLHINAVLSGNKAFSILKLIDITDNKDKTNKGLMVELDVKASDNAGLAANIIFLLKELNVDAINYNDQFYQLQNFKF